MKDRSDHDLRHNLVSLLFLTAIFFLNFLSRIVLAPLLPPIEEDLGVTHGEAGSLFLAISLGYCAGLLGSGFISARVTHRWTIVLSSIAVGGALLAVTLCRTLWGVRLALVFLGMAAGFYLPSGMATLTSLVSLSDWGKAIAIHELAPTMGLMTAPLLAEFLLGACPWRGVLASVGITSVLVGVAFARFGKGGAFPGEAPSPMTIRVLMGEPAFWIMIMLFSMGIGASLGVYTMLPLYLVTERGMDRGLANTLVGLSRVSALFMAFVAGWFTDLAGPRRALTVIFLATGATTILLGLTPGSWIVVPIFLQPMLTVCFFPAGFAALARIGPPGVRNVAVSLTVPVASVLGGGAIPAGIGLIGEVESFAVGVAMAGGLVLGGAMLVRCLHLVDS